MIYEATRARRPTQERTAQRPTPRSIRKRATPRTATFLTNGSFEFGQAAADPSWGNGYGMTFTRVSPGHTGQYACLVCMQGSGDSYEIDNITPVNVGAGSYYVEAWVLAPDSGALGSPGVQVYLDGGDDAGMQGCTGGGQYCQGGFATAPATWTPSSGADSTSPQVSAP